jgi:hypothetical protein
MNSGNLCFLSLRLLKVCCTTSCTSYFPHSTWHTTILRVPHPVHVCFTRIASSSQMIYYLTPGLKHTSLFNATPCNTCYNDPTLRTATCNRGTKLNPGLNIGHIGPARSMIYLALVLLLAIFRRAPCPSDTRGRPCALLLPSGCPIKKNFI